ncbi:MAG: hypothetical protein VW891_10715, partial [Novosphingobium sp.]
MVNNRKHGQEVGNPFLMATSPVNRGVHADEDARLSVVKPHVDSQGGIPESYVNSALKTVETEIQGLDALKRYLE